MSGGRVGVGVILPHETLSLRVRLTILYGAGARDSGAGVIRLEVSLRGRRQVRLAILAVQEHYPAGIARAAGAICWLLNLPAAALPGPGHHSAPCPAWWYCCFFQKCRHSWIFKTTARGEVSNRYIGGVIQHRRVVTNMVQEVVVVCPVVVVLVAARLLAAGRNPVVLKLKLFR